MFGLAVDLSEASELPLFLLEAIKISALFVASVRLYSHLPEALT